METLKTILNQAMMIWTESTGAGRVGIALLLVICVGGLVGVGVWSAQPNYVVLANGLRPDQASQVIDALETANIDYEVRGSGGSIAVDKPDFPKAKILAGKLGIESEEPNLEPDSIWLNPASQREVFRINKQRMLSRSIARMQNVESADVHLSIPKSESFMRPSELPSAAVIVEVAYKSKFSDSEATAIASVVSNSVSGLTSENVSITDTEGNVYSTDNSLGRLTSQVDWRLSFEEEKTSKAERMLIPLLGYGNAAVAVTTDFSFEFGTTESLKYDSENRAIVSEKINTSVTKGGAPVATGVPGTGSNVGNEPRSTLLNDKLTETDDRETDYGVSQTKESRTDQTPDLKMMTVSVIVNKAVLAKADGSESSITQEQISDIVSKAVGLRDSADEITVEFLEFMDDAPDEAAPATAIPWEQINDILKNISLAVAAIVALIVALKVFKSFQPGKADTVAAVDTSSQANQLSDLVKENPEIFSKIIASWSDMDSRSENESSSSKAA